MTDRKEKHAPLSMLPFEITQSSRASLAGPMSSGSALFWWQRSGGGDGALKNIWVTGYYSLTWSTPASQDRWRMAVACYSSMFFSLACSASRLGRILNLCFCVSVALPDSPGLRWAFLLCSFNVFKILCIVQKCNVWNKYSVFWVSQNVYFTHPQK